MAVSEIRAQLQQRTIEEDGFLPDDAPVFLLENQQSLYNYWRFYQRSNGIDPPISLYELRHTFVSVAKTLPLGMVKDIVGHSQNMDTFGVYAHALNGDAEVAAQAVSGAFLQLLTPAGK